MICSLLRGAARRLSELLDDPNHKQARRDYAEAYARERTEKLEAELDQAKEERDRAHLRLREYENTNGSPVV